jgi:hypothetical protein
VKRRALCAVLALVALLGVAAPVQGHPHPPVSRSVAHVLDGVGDSPVMPE